MLDYLPVADELGGEFKNNEIDNLDSQNGGSNTVRCIFDNLEALIAIVLVIVLFLWFAWPALGQTCHYAG